MSSKLACVVDLVALAQPDFREELERQAYEHGLITRGVSFA